MGIFDISSPLMSSSSLREQKSFWHPHEFNASAIEQVETVLRPQVDPSQVQAERLRQGLLSSAHSWLQSVMWSFHGAQQDKLSPDLGTRGSGFQAPRAEACHTE